MRLRCGLTVLLLISAAAVTSNAAELNPHALASCNSYIATANMRMQERLNGTKPFLWIDEDPARRQHLRSGEVVVLPLGKSSTTPVPRGLIHHWIGGVFIPGAQREELIAVMDYSSYDKIYRPTVIKAELLESAGDEQKFSMLWVQRVLFVTVALYAQFDSNSIQLNSRQGYLTLPSTSVQQI